MSEDLTLLCKIYQRVLQSEKIITYNRFGKTYIRKYFIPMNPRTRKQQVHRKMFRNAIHSWKNLSCKEKEYFNNLANGLDISGYNLFVSMKIKSLNPFLLPT